MADRTLVLAIFEDEAARTTRRPPGRIPGLTAAYVMGVLAVDATGKLKEEKAGALPPRPGCRGSRGARRPGHWTTRGLGLAGADRERICRELTSGKAAAGVLTPFNESAMISAKLAGPGGAPEERTVSEEALKAGQQARARAGAGPGQGRGKNRCWPVTCGCGLGSPPRPCTCVGSHRE